MAHAKMLEKMHILTKTELNRVLEVFKDILQDIKAGNFIIEPDFEDVHSKLEYLLTTQLGETGKKIHTGRSRNDQVLVALHLYIRDEIKNIVAQTKTLFEVLTELSEKYKENIIPGYTHMQIAMPSSFGLWFGAYAESLVDDLYFLQAAYRIADQNPLGSAAGYGSSFPLDRTFTTHELGFKDLKYNVVAAQNEPWQGRKVHCYRHGFGRRNRRQAGYGYLPVHGAELRFFDLSRRINYRQQYYAP